MMPGMTAWLGETVSKMPADFDDRFPPRLNLRIMPADIDGATPYVNCPIERAILRLGYEHATVSEEMVTVRQGPRTSNWNYAEYRPTERARAFMRAHDRGVPVKPTRFVFERTSPA